MGGNSILIGVLVLGLLFGGFTGAKISNLNPFKAKPKVVEKSEGHKEEYFRDKIKGIEYRSQESYKNQAPSKNSENQTLGTWVGNLIDTSLQWIMIFGIFSLVLFVFTGIKTWKYLGLLRTKIKERDEKIAIRERALRQTAEGVQIAKGKMNGEKKKLIDALEKSQDEDVKRFLRQFKDEHGIKTNTEDTASH